jgi:hypothetical protein
MPGCHNTFNLCTAILLTFVLLSCHEEDPKNGYSVSGYVSDGSVSVAAVEVRLDGMIQYSATTDGNGYFKINHVPSGDYALESTAFNPNGPFPPQRKT